MKTKEAAGELIKQISEALERDCNNNMRKSGMTLSQSSVLLLLENGAEGATTLKEIEKMLHCAQSTAHGLVTRLEEKGLVASSGHPEDRRVRVVRITDKGRAYCREAKTQMREMEARLLSPLGEGERKQFLDYLSRIRDAIA